MASRVGLVVPAICALVASSWQLAPARANELVDLVAEKAAVLEMLDRKAKRAVATIAKDHFVLDYTVTTRDDVKQFLRRRVEDLLVTVSPGLLAEEIVIVSTSGKPLARVVRGQVDNEPEIDADDSTSVEAAHDLEGETVHTSSIYRSPDTGEWALTYAAAVRDDDEAFAVLHLQQHLGRKLGLLSRRPAPAGIRWYVVEDRARTIFDSARGDMRFESRATGAPDEPAFEQFSVGGILLDELKAEADSSGVELARVGDTPREIAFKTIDHWTIVAVREGRL